MQHFGRVFTLPILGTIYNNVCSGNLISIVFLTLQRNFPLIRYGILLINTKFLCFKAYNLWRILVMNDEHSYRKYMIFFLVSWGKYNKNFYWFKCVFIIHSVWFSLYYIDSVVFKIYCSLKGFVSFIIHRLIN